MIVVAFQVPCPKCQEIGQIIEGLCSWCYMDKLALEPLTDGITDPMGVTDIQKICLRMVACVVRRAHPENRRSANVLLSQRVLMGDILSELPEFAEKIWTDGTVASVRIKEPIPLEKFLRAAESLGILKDEGDDEGESWKQGVG